MINKIIGLIIFLSGIIGAAFIQGKRAEKNKQNAKTISGIKETQKIKKDIAALSRSSKLDLL